MSKTKLIIAAAALCAAFVATGASAMPIAAISTDAVSNVENVRWVCGPYRCWWQPNYYYGGYNYYGPRRFYGGWGYHRGWGRRW
jgi:hypothetical protein